MKKTALVLALLAASCAPAEAPDPDLARWEARAANVTIVRDDWGIPHITAPTDADAIFGMMYAQAEDDFNRVEVNFLNSQGLLAQAEGEGEIWRDLRMRLFIDPEDLMAQYAAAPDWLKALMDAWADGLNYYLHTHPEVQPKVLARFEPWMALSFSEGSIGGDIERVDLRDLQAFYEALEAGSGAGAAAAAKREADVLPLTRTARADAILEEDMARMGEGWLLDRTGSNGIALAGSVTASGNAMLLINPHTSFFFRHEAHVKSDEGLNAYGASTWGQFFVYQGFNETAGWMHTSSSVDNIDEYLETVVEKEDGLYYVHGGEERPLQTRQVTIDYRTDAGMAQRTFTVYRTHHGPIVRQQDGKWVSVALMEEPLSALMQSYGRTKAKNLADYRQNMEMHTNSSNNTLFADADGNIAYFHSNFVPRRDASFDWGEPVDGSDPATDWNGVHSQDESPNVFNPPNGWVYNTNNFPYSAAGPGNSPRQADYPPYMDAGSENFRGIHAMQVLGGKTGFTLEGLRDAAFDSWLPGFVDLVPALVRAYDRAPASDPLKAALAEPVEVLRAWDLRWGAESVATSLAVFAGDELLRQVAADARAAGVNVYDYAATRASSAQLLGALGAATEKLGADFGTWQTPWGEINRFQRLTGDIVQPFSDEGESTPVGFASGRWGSLASFAARAYPGTKRWYGTSGNSFVAVVEFGERVRALAVTAGGLNNVPGTPHFNDQAQRYATGDLREVYFYPDQLEGHVERTYRPGER
ncbi:MAG: 7-beta-(4-carbaxybutanamido)cephalosporanic acid acylase [Gemmatimonadota bacterium]